MAQLAARLSAKVGHLFDRVDYAFLQISDPLIETRIEEQVGLGAKKIVVFPFFIGSGSHILQDIPQLVKKKQDQFPDVVFEITPHLGRLKTIEQVIADEVGKYCG